MDYLRLTRYVKRRFRGTINRTKDAWLRYAENIGDCSGFAGSIARKSFGVSKLRNDTWGRVTPRFRVPREARQRTHIGALEERGKSTPSRQAPVLSLQSPNLPRIEQTGLTARNAAQPIGME